MKHKYVDYVSALKAEINPDAVVIIKELYNLDREQTQYPKLLGELQKI